MQFRSLIKKMLPNVLINLLKRIRSRYHRRKRAKILAELPFIPKIKTAEETIDTMIKTKKCIIPLIQQEILNKIVYLLVIFNI